MPQNIHQVENSGFTNAILFYYISGTSFPKVNRIKHQNKDFWHPINMKIKLNTLLFVILLNLNCLDNHSVTTYHGLLNENNLDKIVNVEPRNYLSFGELVNRVEQIACNDSIPTIIIKNGKYQKLLGLANPCWGKFACLLIKQRNVLKIKDEKIIRSNEISLDSLEVYIKKHYENNGKDLRFSELPSRAMISINYSDRNMSNLKSILNEILTEYEKLNLEEPLIISLDRNIPPPPPLPNKKIKLVNDYQ